MQTRTRSNTIVAAGVGVALLGAMLVLAYGRSITSGGATGPMVSAYVATADIAAGTKWEEASGSISQEQVPESLRPAAAVTDSNRPEGRTSVRTISAGEVVTTSQFGASGSTPPAAGLEIPPGHNAVTVNMAIPQGVGRYPQPGDLVNIYVTFKGGVPDAPVTRLVMQHIQVLQTRPAGLTGEPTGGEILFTLALTPDAAEHMIFAKENGSVWFGLVRPGDEPVATGGRNFQSVLP